MVKYANELTEVYTILNTLVKEDYDKIPKITIQAIEENMNPDYEYELDEELELKDCPMLPGTKEILFNLFRDYLCTPEQRKKIKKMQAEDRLKDEMKRQQEYNVDIFANRPKEETQEENLELVVYKENIFTKILKFIKNIFKR